MDYLDIRIPMDSQVVIQIRIIHWMPSRSPVIVWGIRPHMQLQRGVIYAFCRQRELSFRVAAAFGRILWMKEHFWKKLFFLFWFWPSFDQNSKIFSGSYSHFDTAPGHVTPNLRNRQFQAHWLSNSSSNWEFPNARLECDVTWRILFKYCLPQVPRSIESIG